jgi:hypothetical protein
MCQSTSTMKRRILDTFFSDFFSRDFLSLILTKHRKNKKKIFNFSIYLENYLLLRDKTRKRFLNESENFYLKLLIYNDLFDENIIFFFSFFLFFSFRFSSSFFFSFFFSFLERIRTQYVLRTSIIRNVDAFLFFDERAKLDRDIEAKMFEKMNRNIINIFIDVSFRRSLKNVDL